MTPIEQIQSDIIELESALLSAHPSMPTLLQSIHKKLKADQAVVTLLSEDEIAIIINGLKVQTNVAISSGSVKKANASPKAKSSSASSRLSAIIKGANLTPDDF